MKWKRFLGWSLLALAGAALVVWAYVAAGSNKARDELEALLAEQKAAGLGTSIEDFLAQYAPVDAEALAAFRAWAEAPAPVLPDDVEPLGSDDRERAYMQGHVAMPEAVRRWHEAQRPRVQAFEALPAGQLQSIASHAWWHEHVRQHGVPDFATALETIEGSPYWRLFDVAEWYRSEALYGDAAAALRGLERLELLLRPHAAPLDLMGGMTLSRIRARCVLLLAWRGRLPAAERERWMAQPSPPVAELARALRGARLLHDIPLAHALVNGEPTGSDYGLGYMGGDIWEDTQHELYKFFDAAYEAVGVVRERGLVERVLRGEAPRSKLAAVFPLVIPGGLLRTGAMNLTRYLIFRHIAWRANHRLERLAVRLMTTGQVPTTEELAGGPDDLALVYEALPGGGHRLGYAASQAQLTLAPPLEPDRSGWASANLGKVLIPGNFAVNEGNLEWGPAPAPPPR